MATGDFTRHFGSSLVARLAVMLDDAAKECGTAGNFHRRRFEAVAPALEELSLMQRVARIGEALIDALPDDPTVARAVMVTALPEPLPASGKPFNEGYWMLPLAAYWAIRYERAPRDVRAPGRRHVGATSRDELWPVAMHALEELTQRGTAEFAVRPFATDNAKKMAETVVAWCEHPSLHVRRLASEGTRPYLPWGGKLRITREDRLLILENITPLCRDPSTYVRRSVGNHVRDWRRIDGEVADTWLSDNDPPADVAKLAIPKRRKP
ncbi:MAG: hypothetical protein GVY23_02935 [Spirochaetes bacterium]|jgi:3-methyladenine DNA glycosylase AlkC|nr:hypothetical protein [Spirochaetota bacterium]